MLHRLALRRQRQEHRLIARRPAVERAGVTGLLLGPGAFEIVILEGIEDGFGRLCRRRVRWYHVHSRI